MLTLAERLARCVRGLQPTVSPRDWLEKVIADHFAENNMPDMSGDMRKRCSPRTLRRVEDCAEAILAALDMDALAREVEAMVGEETERCIAIVQADAHYKHADRIIAAIRAREGGKP
jgi:hypothetical protein